MNGRCLRWGVGLFSPDNARLVGGGVSGFFDCGRGWSLVVWCARVLFEVSVAGAGLGWAGLEGFLFIGGRGGGKGVRGFVGEEMDRGVIGGCRRAVIEASCKLRMVRVSFARYV